MQWEGLGMGAGRSVIRGQRQSAAGCDSPRAVSVDGQQEWHHVTQWLA